MLLFYNTFSQVSLLSPPGSPVFGPILAVVFMQHMWPGSDLAILYVNAATAKNASGPTPPAPTCQGLA